MKVKVIEEIDSAHRLNWYQGKCSNLHGHRWKIEVMIIGEICKDGMVVDFRVIKEVIRELDHRYLNEILENPTAEELVIFLKQKIKERVKGRKVKRIKVRVWESSNAYVEG